MNRVSRIFLHKMLFYLPFILGLLLSFTQIKSAANLYDEGLVLTNAERIRAGEIPYRDFWTMYGPGYFYALAGLFSLVSPTIFVARLFDTILRFLLTLEVYLLARTMTSRWVALIPYAFVTFWLATIRFYSYPAFPATGALLLAALSLTGYLRDGRSRWLFLSGMALGLTALLRLDFGGYGAFGFSLALALFELRKSAAAGDAGPSRLLRLLKVEMLMAAGALLVALPLYVYLLLASGFATVYYDLIVFPATVFRAVRHLPVLPLLPDFGRLTGGQWNDWLRLYFPLTIYAIAILVSLHWLVLRRVSPSDPRFVVGGLFLALTGTGLGLVVKALSRYHDLHVLPTTICAVILATALGYRIPGKFWQNAPFKIGFAGLAFLFLTGPYVAHFSMLATRGSTAPAVCYSQQARAGCVLISQDQERVTHYLRANTRPDEYVFIGNSRHDLIFINDLLLYFLIDRRSPTKYTELHPGLATTLPVQQVIANDLAEKDVQWVVIMQGWESGEPNASSMSSGVTFLDDYIREYYRPEITFGSYQVWRKRP
ncbi:MAG: glycosyltransferase family 39 protein [Anaerolineae bacterium]|nr:glycosyltransferase family 39 protein [Anaerolineae bacterium]